MVFNHPQLTIEQIPLMVCTLVPDKTRLEKEIDEHESVKASRFTGRDILNKIHDYKIPDSDFNPDLGYLDPVMKFASRLKRSSFKEFKIRKEDIKEFFEYLEKLIRLDEAKLRSRLDEIFEKRKGDIQTRMTRNGLMESIDLSDDRKTSYMKVSYDSGLSSNYSLVDAKKAKKKDRCIGLNYYPDGEFMKYEYTWKHPLLRDKLYLELVNDRQKGKTIKFGLEEKGDGVANKVYILSPDYLSNKSIWEAGEIGFYLSSTSTELASDKKVSGEQDYIQYAFGGIQKFSAEDGPNSSFLNKRGIEWDTEKEFLKTGALDENLDVECNPFVSFELNGGQYSYKPIAGEVGAYNVIFNIDQSEDSKLSAIRGLKKSIFEDNLRIDTAQQYLIDYKDGTKLACGFGDKPDIVRANIFYPDGSTYVGHIKIAEKMSEERLFEIFSQDFERSAGGKLYNKFGDLVFDGEWQNDEPYEGSAISLPRLNPQTNGLSFYTGDIKNGEYEDADGQLVFDGKAILGNFSQSELNGKATIYSSKALIHGNFKDGRGVEDQVGTRSFKN